ncbi:MAG: tetratricopeptide repeat protein [Gammaproteobacteria bacterium]|nr:tetratricopeptide repeat protein [Gammaproteobacteria bacterium]
MAIETEEEQVEKIKTWWKNNGSTLIIGIVFGVTALFATQYWRSSQSTEQEAASALFTSVLSGVEEGDAKKVMESGSPVLAEYSHSPYAVLTAFALAKVKHEADDLEAAQTYLKWVLDHSDDMAMLHIARLRLALVTLDQEKGEEALALLDSVDPGAFVSQYEELRGDIQVSLAHYEKARQAYTVAVSTAKGDSSIQQMKLDDLPGDAATGG